MLYLYIVYVYGYLKYVQELCDYFTHLYLQIVHNLCRHGKCYSKLIIYSTGLPAFLLVCLSRSDLSACLPASVPVCLSCILLSVSLSTCLPFLLSRHLSLSACFVSACLSFCLSSFVSLQLSTCLSACLSVYKSQFEYCTSETKIRCILFRNRFHWTPYSTGMVPHGGERDTPTNISDGKTIFGKHCIFQPVQTAGQGRECS